MNFVYAHTVDLAAIRNHAIMHMKEKNMRSWKGDWPESKRREATEGRRDPGRSERPVKPRIGQSIFSSLLVGGSQHPGSSLEGHY